MSKQATKVLFIDDDTVLGSMVLQGLTYLGYNVHYQSSMIALDSIISEFCPNIIILDIEIGDKDGIDDSARIRILFPNIPIIFVSSHVDTSYVVKALENGGVTYIKKPIDIEELAAYINRYALKSPTDTRIVIGNFILDKSSRLLTNTENNTTETLNNKEVQLIEMLANNIGCVVTRETIIAQIWNDDFSSDQVLNNYISHIRKCISSDSSISIETMPRQGYRLLLNVNQECTISV
ncbi:MAG: response regulator transcription factor [Tannerellaceae bacterium]